MAFSLGIYYIEKVGTSNYINHLFTTKGGKLRPLVQVREKARITLPSKIRKALGVKEGDYLEAEVENNKIVLIAKVLIDKANVNVKYFSQCFGEGILREVLEDVKKGKVKEFKNVEQLINDLDK